MTGFGESHCRRDGLSVAIEIRAINNRFLKLTVRTSEGYAALEPLVEAAVRRAVHRGTIQVNVRVDRRPSPEDYKINVDVLEQYHKQLRSVMQGWKKTETRDPPLEALLPLPGVVNDTFDKASGAAADWPLIEPTLREALENLGRMRADEGRAMAADLEANCRTAVESLDRVQQRAPLVVEDYRNRLHERLQRVLAEYQVTLEPADLIKEVSLFADRGDVSEEIVRLRSHLQQFRSTMELTESSGRKLDFLTQEMFREANTIGSKANDVEIAQEVIEIKTAVERIREMIQNIE
ncbi:MAG: YicC family protein [Planctomycetes bacterium]|nr:YicC family protein [Planctomycetota bacterium]MBU4397967.1 YicC family protein [Planctomycetota bacterium]MCG2682110.1 YicC family protein [Planctomycetales bacterium]